MFFKRAYKIRPPRPRYSHTWDPEVVLSFLENSPTNEDLHFQQLSDKTTTLLALSTAHRLQTFSLIRVDQITQSAAMVEIMIPDRIKTSRPGNFQPLLTLPFLPDRPKICVITIVLAYISKN